MAISQTLSGRSASQAGTVVSIRSANHLLKEYETMQALYRAQTSPVQSFLQVQAKGIITALVDNLPSVDFWLPEQVAVEIPGRGLLEPRVTPVETRYQSTRSLLGRLTHKSIHSLFRQRLTELEHSPDPAISTSAALLRHTAAVSMIYQLLPSGRPVSYVAAEGEDLPSIPLADSPLADTSGLERTVAVGAALEDSKAFAKENQSAPDMDFARRFYLPQWVAFNEDAKLMADSVKEAEAHVASMQRFMAILHTSVGLAPYIVADEEYQQKRYGILGQLVNQGRALARYQTEEIVRTIEGMAANRRLNRGLSLVLPFFDDQDLRVKEYRFEVIPPGRVMFVPAFIVIACQREQVLVSQNTRLGLSTRRHLLAELYIIERAFENFGRSQ